FHFHDLRHSGNTLAAGAGATLRELMDRMGHESERAAMIYLHGSDARQHQIADSLSKLAREELKRGSKRPGGQASGARSGTQRARAYLGEHLIRSNGRPVQGCPSTATNSALVPRMSPTVGRSPLS